MNKLNLTFLAITMIDVFAFFGCDKKESGETRNSNKSTTQVASKNVQNKNLVFPQTTYSVRHNEDTTTMKVCIDSIPPGASVFLVPANYYEGKLDLQETLGTAPLVLDPSQCSSMTFWVAMDVDEYLEHVRSITEMEDWIADLKGGYFGEADTDLHHFNFGYQAVMKTKDPENNLLKAIGPICKLKWPEEKRICVLFIPRTVSYMAFYSLMPKPGTFTLPSEGWQGFLRKKCMFSDQQVNEAAECLTRCGTYLTRVKDTSNLKKAIDYCITLQDPRSGWMLSKKWDVDLDHPMYE